jgi:hypothetical protein
MITSSLVCFHGVFIINNICICVGPIGKSIDISCYEAPPGMDVMGKHVYQRDLMGLLKVQYNLLFGKDAKFVGESGADLPADVNQLKDGYDVREAIANADRIQGTDFTSSIADMLVVLPSRPLKR